MKEAVSHIGLQGKDELAFKDAYRSLPRTGELSVTVTASEILVSLELLEKTGFAGMRVDTSGQELEEVSIHALKGKQGPCYDTGRTALYTGSALVALDDDYHLLFAGSEETVCEKTATLYNLSTYRSLIRCSKGNKELLSRLQREPKPFDCDTFEASVERLHRRLNGKYISGKSAPEPTTPLFYPGPFRLLVLEDGTMVRRGLVNRVPTSMAERLQRTDGLFPVKDGLLPVKEGIGAGPELFQERYLEIGPRCLMVNPGGAVVRPENREPDYSKLFSIPGGLKTKLLETIDREKEYFILTGSNREDELGCCPSDEVTWADRLVRAGILCSYREDAPPDACPVTIYAFRHEISGEGSDLRFTTDEEFRQALLPRMSYRTGEAAKRIVRWALLLFVAVGIVLAVTRLSRSPATSFEQELYQWLGGKKKDATVLVLFHFSRRCTECLAMEEYTREVLHDFFAGAMNRGNLLFRMAVIDLPENRTVMERMGIASISMAIITFRDGEEKSIVKLERAGMLYENESEFKAMLIEHIEQVLKMENE